MPGGLVSTAWQVDIFANQGNTPSKDQTIESRRDSAARRPAHAGTAGVCDPAFRRAEKKRTGRRGGGRENMRGNLRSRTASRGCRTRRQYDDALKAALAAPPRGGAVHAVFLLDLKRLQADQRCSRPMQSATEVLIVVGAALDERGARRPICWRASAAMIVRDPCASFGRAGSCDQCGRCRVIPGAGGCRSPPADCSTKSGAGIGIAVVPNDATPRLLKRCARLTWRCMAPKRNAASALRFFEPHMDRQVRGAASKWRRICARRWKNGGISTVYQPSFKLEER